MREFRHAPFRCLAVIMIIKQQIPPLGLFLEVHSEEQRNSRKCRESISGHIYSRLSAARSHGASIEPTFAETVV